MAFCLVLGAISPAEGLYLSQFAVFLLIVAAAAAGLMRRDAWVPLACVAVVGLLVVLSLAAGARGNLRFMPELLKGILLLSGAVAFASFVRWPDVDAIADLFPRLLLVMLLGVKVAGLGDYYGEEGRFGLPWLGSPNNTGFLIALALAMVLYRWPRGRAPGRLTARLAFDTLTLVVLAAFLVATQSLGGMLSAVVVALRFAGLGLARTLWSLLGVTVAVVVVVVVVPAIEVPELIGSGRLLIWQSLLDEYLSAGPRVLAVGFGPGAIDLMPFFTASVQSAHSMYVEVLYAYGATGFVLLLFGLRRWGRRLGGMDPKSVRSRLLDALFASLVVGFFVDTYVMSAQLTWTGAMLLGLAALPPDGRRRAR